MLLQTPLPEFDPSIAEEFGYATVGGPSFLGIPLFDGQSLIHLLLRFAFNLIVSLLISWLCYYRRGGSKKYFLTFMLFSSAMFMLLFMMGSVSLQIGFTLGLFAIFGMIRYRTETIPVREMTYLFVIIALSVINGIGLNISYAELVLANALVLLLIVFSEISRNRTSTKIVLYDNIKLIKPECKTELVSDLRQRLGLDIVDVEVGHVDFLRDAAYLKVTYRIEKGEKHTIETMTKYKPE